MCSWCPPCRSLGPLLEEVSSRRQLLLAKVDIDILPGIALDYEVFIIIPNTVELLVILLADAF